MILNIPKELEWVPQLLRRDGKNLKEKDPVLDTMISVIQVEEYKVMKEEVH